MSTSVEYHVNFRFGKGVPPDLQAASMMMVERWLREKGIPAEVFKDNMADDSRLRLAMTEERRAKL